MTRVHLGLSVCLISNLISFEAPHIFPGLLPNYFCRRKSQLAAANHNVTALAFQAILLAVMWLSAASQGQGSTCTFSNSRASIQDRLPGSLEGIPQRAPRPVLTLTAKLSSSVVHLAGPCSALTSAPPRTHPFKTSTSSLSRKAIACRSSRDNLPSSWKVR